jgi:multidrug efflux system outer membrane protein
MTAAGGRAAVLMLAVAAAGCATTSDYHPPAPAVPARWSEAPESSAPATPSQAAWWTTFGDAELDSLVERAVRANLDLQLGEARVREARARRRAAAAPLWPAIDARASIARERDSANAPAPVRVSPGGQLESRPGDVDNLFQAGFDASWEIDLFGGRRRSVEAAQADLESAVYDRGAVMLTLLAEVARNYIELRGLQQRLAVQRGRLAARQDLLNLTRSRYAGGMASEFDVVRAEAQVEAAASQIPALEAACKETVHRLGVLLGQAPGALADELLPGRPLPVAAARLPVGLPSDLLRQRPDIRRAERQLAAASARVGVATADLYPKFSLLGTAGLASVAASDFFSRASTLWSIGPSMTWPIFRGGQIVATIEVRDAQQQQALIGYRRAILNALEDVENALVACRREQDRRAALARVLDANQRAVDLGRTLYRGGMTDFRAVLDAERDLFQAQDDLARSDTAAARDLVALYKALGGGWDAPTLPSAAMPPDREPARLDTAGGASK